MNIKQVMILLEKEWRDFFSGKAWVIALVLPLFITFLFATVYRETAPGPFKVGIISPLDPVIQKILTSSNFKTNVYSNLPEAKQDLATSQIDGVIYAKSPQQTILLVSGASAEKASLVANAINASLIQIFSRQNLPRIKLEVSGAIRKVSTIALPLWLIQIILTISLLQNSAAIAEEKAKHILHSLLVSPVTLPEYFTSKIIWSSLLGCLSIFITVLLTGFDFQPGYLMIFSLVGCIVYSAAALLIGLITPNAVMARTISTTFYLISALPLMIKNTTFRWKTALEFIPSFPILHGLEKAILLTPLEAQSLIFLGILAAEALLLLLITYFSIKNNLDF